MPHSFVLGDIHGQAIALKELLKKANFDFEKDLLICLGDLVDRGPDSKGVMDIFMRIKNVRLVLGNHDKWFLDFLEYGQKMDRGEMLNWQMNGMADTKRSFGVLFNDVKKLVAYRDFLRKAEKRIKIDKDVFVHGGFDPNRSAGEQMTDVLIWDRDLITIAKRSPIPNYRRVFVGHSKAVLLGEGNRPERRNNLIMMDTGAGYPERNGRLSMMNLETEEVISVDVR